MWANPADGREWVYAGTEPSRDRTTTSPRSTRFADRRPERARAGLEQDAGEHRHVSGVAGRPACRRAVSVAAGRRRRAAERQPARSSARAAGRRSPTRRGPLFWYFDGAHRNLTMVDVGTDKRWMVNINTRPGLRQRRGLPSALDEPSALPRDLRSVQPGRRQPGPERRRADRGLPRPLQRRLLARSRPGRASRSNAGGDSYPDVWIDRSEKSAPDAPADGTLGPAAASAAPAGPSATAAAGAGRLVVKVRLDEGRTDPDSGVDRALSARAGRQRVRDHRGSSRAPIRDQRSWSRSGRFATAGCWPARARRPAAFTG